MAATQCCAMFAHRRAWSISLLLCAVAAAPMFGCSDDSAQSVAASSSSSSGEGSGGGSSSGGATGSGVGGAGGGNGGAGGSGAGDLGPPVNPVGIGLVGPGNSTQWDKTAELTGRGGHIKLIFAGIDMNTSGPPQDWVEAVNQVYARDLVPVIRLGTALGRSQHSPVR